MITPAYSPTATERVLPRLALDFTTGVLDPRVTVTRALNTATRVTSAGVIAVVNADLPRFDYDPATLAPKGLLIEETRKNELICSDTFDNAIWFKSNTSIDKDTIVSPDGTQNGDYLKEDSATSTHRISQDVTLPSTTTYTYTIYYKITDTTRKVALQHTPSNTGRVFDANGGQEAGLFNAPVSFSVTAFNNGWYRASISVAGIAGGNSFRVWLVRASDNAINYAGNGTSGVYIYGADAEAGAFATSYIPTGTVTATRNADVVTMTGTNFSSWFNASEGTAAVWFNGFESGNGNLLTFSNGTNQNFISNFVQAATTYGLYTIASGALQASINFGTPAPLNAQNKIVMGYKAASNSASFNGAAVVAGNSGTIPTVDRLNIGSDPVLTAGNFFNGTMQRIFYWPYKLADAQIRAFAK